MSTHSSRDRLVWLISVVDDLGRAFEQDEIGRWFDQPRPELGGWAPVDLLEDDWSPDDSGPLRVRQLADALARRL